MRIIRPAMPTDIRVLAEMLEALIREHETQYPETYPKLEAHSAAAHYAAEWHRRLQDDPACHVWLATDRDVRGFLAGEVWSRLVGEPPVSFFMEWLYVVPEHRRGGIARALYREGLLPYCRRHGIDVLEGRIEPGDMQWSRRGWAIVAQSIMRGVDAVALDVMERPSDRLREETRQ
jgi:GNAT superfamily N-acetyltransferase